MSELGIVDRVVETNAEAVKAPISSSCASRSAPAARSRKKSGPFEPGAIVSDVGSVKGAVVREMAPHCRGRAFRAGASGRRHRAFRPRSGFAELFIDRWCILTPPEARPRRGGEAARFLGRDRRQGRDHDARASRYGARDHSHLPHLIAYTIVGTADELEGVTQSEVLKFSAGGFRDFTRIAASDPIMWRDVFLANKDAVLEMLGTFNEDLSKLTRAIRRGDGEALFEHFTRTRAIRRGIVRSARIPRARFRPSARAIWRKRRNRVEARKTSIIEKFT